MNNQRYDYILYKIIKHLKITRFDNIIELNLKPETQVRYDS